MMFIKYSDDTVIMDIAGNSEGHLQAELDKFLLWCIQNYLDLNATKPKTWSLTTEETNLPSPPLEINRQIIERVEDYKFLGTIIGNKLALLQKKH